MIKRYMKEIFYDLKTNILKNMLLLFGIMEEQDLYKNYLYDSSLQKEIMLEHLYII